MANDKETFFFPQPICLWAMKHKKHLSLCSKNLLMQFFKDRKVFGLGRQFLFMKTTVPSMRQLYSTAALCIALVYSLSRIWVSRTAASLPDLAKENVRAKLKDET